MFTGISNYSRDTIYLNKYICVFQITRVSFLTSYNNKKKGRLFKMNGDEKQQQWLPICQEEFTCSRTPNNWSNDLINKLTANTKRI